jgi:hypothetical protein
MEDRTPPFLCAPGTQGAGAQPSASGSPVPAGRQHRLAVLGFWILQPWTDREEEADLPFQVMRCEREWDLSGEIGKQNHGVPDRERNARCS